MLPSIVQLPVTYSAFGIALLQQVLKYTSSASAAYIPAPRAVVLCLLPIRRQMLEYTDSAVTRNASEKKINSLLDFISSSSDLDLLQVWLRAR
jgi:hypothetical protein